MIRDADLRRIYYACGWRGLVQSETYAEASVFDTDFFVQFEDFFAGKDEDDRQYLLPPTHVITHMSHHHTHVTSSHTCHIIT